MITQLQKLPLAPPLKKFKKHRSRLIGKICELLAVQMLEKEGYIILENNFLGRHGEIDIICFDGKSIIFVEVKARQQTPYAPPFEALYNAITSKKLENIYHTAATFDRSYKHYALKSRFKKRRYDSVLISFRMKYGVPIQFIIRHIKNVSTL